MTSTPAWDTRSHSVDRVIDLDAPRPAPSRLRVAVVHDYLTQRGGAERVVLSLMQAFPDARLITSVYDPDKTFPEFAQYDVETTWLNRLPVFRADPRRAMPLLPTVFSGVQLTDVDVVICSSSGWAHGIRTTAPKIVYCHNPARWLYQRHQYVGEHGALVRGMIKGLSPYLKWWDRKAATTVDTYLANSTAVAGRIQREYGLTAQIVPPAVTIDPFAHQEPVAGVSPGFLLCVSRSRGYKNTAVVAAAVESVSDERLVIVGGLPDGTWSSRLTGVTDVSEAQLRWLYANCSAVVGASHEDFGLSPVEGYAFGKPALCLRAGGYLDTMDEGVSGLFFDELTPASLAECIRRFRGCDLSTSAIEAHARQFGFDAFRQTLVTDAELALALHGVDPLGSRVVSAQRDHVAALRRPVSVALSMCLLLTLLLGTAAGSENPTVTVLCGALVAISAVLGRLRYALRGSYRGRRCIAPSSFPRSRGFA